MGKTIPLADRFWSKVQKTELCWLWVGSTDNHGYGGIRLSPTKMAKAHRVAYELVVGPIPEGMELDHLCRVRNCVNPRHLEPVPGRVNALRGEGAPARNARKTHCPRGHLLPEVPNHGHSRRCNACRRDQWKPQARKR